MKICYVSGNAPRVFKLMKDMVNRGHEVCWIPLNTPKFYVEGVNIYDALVTKDQSYIKKVLWTVIIYFKFRKLIHQVKPDIVHAINIRKAGWLAVLSKFDTVIVTPQGGDVMVKERDYFHLTFFKRWLKKSFIDQWLRVNTIKNAKIITFGNQTMLKAIHEWAKPRQTFKYFQGVDFEVMKGHQMPQGLKEELGLGQSKIVFSPRMFNSNSNIDIVIKSIPQVAQVYPNVKFIFLCHLGVDSYFSKLKLLADELNVNDHCLFMDEVKSDEMYNYYAISDVVVSLLSSDGMPATVLEVLAMKKPQVLSNIPIYQEVFSDFVSMTELRDPNSTSESIISSIEAGNHISKKLERGFSWVENHADQKLLNDNLEDLYRKVIV